MRPAESSLNTENREYLLKIGDLLTERPGLQLSMCGVATTADREALAAMRTQVVTDFLAAEIGISTERLFTCRETIDADAEAQPRVRLSL